jgi:hypothetical protein
LYAQTVETSLEPSVAANRSCMQLMMTKTAAMMMTMMMTWKMTMFFF